MLKVSLTIIVNWHLSSWLCHLSTYISSLVGDRNKLKLDCVKGEFFIHKLSFTDAWTVLFKLKGEIQKSEPQSLYPKIQSHKISSVCIWQVSPPDFILQAHSLHMSVTRPRFISSCLGNLREYISFEVELWLWRAFLRSYANLWSSHCT